MKMRFPYFYQLLIIFFTIIVSLMVIPFFTILHYGRTQLLNEVEADFIEYAELIYDAESHSDKEKLAAYKDILRSRNVEYGIFDQDGRLEYPEDERAFQLELDQKDLEKLKANKNVLLRIHDTDLSGELNDTALVYIPIFDKEGIYEGFIGVGRPFKYIEVTIRTLRISILKVFLIATLFAGLVSILFSYLMVKRIDRLSNASRRVAAGDYDVYIDHSNRDEIDRLSADFNKMIKALKEWRKEVIHLEERRKNFMQDAIHEMRTPLTTINGLLEGLEYGIFDQAQEKRSIEIMKKETSRLIRLVNENLDYENIESNRITLQKNIFSLDEAMIEIKEQLHPIIAEMEINIKINENIQDVEVYADFDRFKQVLVNLLKNAIQFTEEGIIEIEAYEDSRYTFIKISDTGIGMTEEQLENIWDRYYKADPSRKNTKFGESGLGLSIVHKLVELHDGYIEVDSKLNMGSQFLIAFPKKIKK